MFSGPACASGWELPGIKAEVCAQAHSKAHTLMHHTVKGALRGTPCTGPGVSGDPRALQHWVGVLESMVYRNADC